MRQHIGSTISLVLGILLFLGEIKDHRTIGPSLFIILGACAYRSAKKRRLGQIRSSLLRIICEVIAVLLIVAIVFVQNDLSTLMMTQPVQYFIIPVWAINAYIVAILNPKFKPESPSV
jgi:hypothetical protein